MAKKKGKYLNSSQNIKVINPYTFIPIPLKKKGEADRTDAEKYYSNSKKLHTGMLRCCLQVVTPLAIPDTEGEHSDNTYIFYEQEEKPAIPGSSLRGMIRSAYETVTDSCMSTVSKDYPLSFREEARRAYEPGILIKKNGQYYLYKAERSLLIIKGGIKNEEKDFDYYYSVEEHNDAKKCPMTLKNGYREIYLDTESVYLKTGAKVWVETVPSKHYKGNQLVWGKGGVVQNISTKKQGVKKTKVDSKIKEGILCLGEPITVKHGESVFTKVYNRDDEPVIVYPSKEDDESLANQNLAQAYEKLIKTLDIYRSSVNKNFYDKNDESDSEAASKKHRGYCEFENLNLKDGIPVWYKIDESDAKNKKIYLSYAAIGRTMNQNTLNSLLGDVNSCSNRNSLCEACLLFGMKGGSNEEKGLGSRIRFTDAHLDRIREFDRGKDCTTVMLKELGMPRYSYMPFYAKYENKDGIPWSYDEDDVAIAGRKYYWHNITAQKNRTVYEAPKDIEGTKATKRTAILELMNPGVLFSFDIYFDGITEDQLKKLEWVITIGQNDLSNLPYSIDSQEDLHCHKLGRGKPLGLGSVKIIIEEKWERLWDCETGKLSIKKEKVEKIDLPQGLAQDSVKKFCHVTSMKHPLDKSNIENEVKIDYPNILYKDNSVIPVNIQQEKGNNHLARHQWYTSNKRKLKGQDSAKGQRLPGVMEPDQNQTMYQFRYVEEFPAKIKKRIGAGKEPNHIEYEIEILGENPFLKQKCTLLADQNKGELRIDSQVYVRIDKEIPKKRMTTFYLASNPNKRRN